MTVPLAAVNTAALVAVVSEFGNVTDVAATDMLLSVLALNAFAWIRLPETVAVEPAGGVGAVGECAAVEGGADLGCAEGEAEVAGVALMDGVHGEATGLVGGLGEEGEVECHMGKKGSGRIWIKDR